MQYSSLILALLPSAYGLAQYGSYGDSSSSTVSAASSQSTSGSSSSSGSGTKHVVAVGKTGLTFEPSEIKASVGDWVEFHFWPQAHSVAQSTFDAPCVPVNSTTGGQGFFSGKVPSTSGMADKVFKMQVNSSAPIWFYCATGKHCQSGMVGAINVNSTSPKTLTAYKALAAKAAANVEPKNVQGGSVEAMDMSSSTGSNPSSTASGSPASSSPSTGAGVEARGDIRWGLFGITGAAAVVGGLLI